MIQYFTDFFQRKRIGQSSQFRPVEVFRKTRDCLLDLCNINDILHIEHLFSFVRQRCMCGVVLRHFRRHVSDNALHDIQGNAVEPGEIAESMSATVEVLHADGS